MKDKPDFEKMAEHTYPNPYVCDGLDITPCYRTGFQDGCKKTWNDEVVPRDAKIAELENDKTNLRNYNINKYNELFAEITRLKSELDKANKELEMWRDQSQHP